MSAVSPCQITVLCSTGPARSGSVQVPFTRGPFGLRSESVQVPCGFRSGFVRDPFEGRAGFVRNSFGFRSGSEIPRQPKKNAALGGVLRRFPMADFRFCRTSILGPILVIERGDSG